MTKYSKQCFFKQKYSCLLILKWPIFAVSVKYLDFLRTKSYSIDQRQKIELKEPFNQFVLPSSAAVRFKTKVGARTFYFTFSVAKKLLNYLFLLLFNSHTNL